MKQLGSRLDDVGVEKRFDGSIGFLVGGWVALSLSLSG